MATKTIKRAYRYSDGAFTKVVDNLILAARRDIAALSPLGISVAWLDALKVQNNTFAEAIGDNFVLGERVIHTIAKNKYRAAILYQSQLITKTAIAYFGVNDSRAASFRYGNLSRETDDKFLRDARSIAKAAEKYTAELSAEGITPTMIAEYRALQVLFDTELNEKYYSNTNRTIATYTRIAMGNELYKKLRILSTKGKLCWANKNPALYGHYVLYPRKKK